jgi:hypothetical protein
MKISDKTKKTVLREFVPIIFSGSYTDETIVGNIKTCKELLRMALIHY